MCSMQNCCAHVRRPLTTVSILSVGHNRITWPSGCCDGDLVIITFRDEQGDGNAGNGLLQVNNTPATLTYRLECVPSPLEPRPAAHADSVGLRRMTCVGRVRSGEIGYTWKTYGPFCANEGWHNLTYTSDANPSETSYEVYDSYGLLKAKGGMSDFPTTFYTYSPSKFCNPGGGLTSDQQTKRNRKLIAYNDQRTPRDQLLRQGHGVPQDVVPPLTVYDNS